MSTYSFKPGDRVGPAGRFVIEYAIGHGGWGEVYRARDKNTGGLVALKVLHSFGDNAAARFKQEAFDETRVCETHRGRRYVVNVIWVSEEHETPPYLAMEFLEGRTAAAFLNYFLGKTPEFAEHQRIAARHAHPGFRRNPPGPGVGVDIILGACLGVAEAHACGIVHRDLSLANIFVLMERDVEDDPERGLKMQGIKVIDFGLSLSSFSRWHSNAGKLVGTPAFLPPERLRPLTRRTTGQEINYERGDERGDQYALAVGLFHLLTGHWPYIALDDYEAMGSADKSGRLPAVYKAILDGELQSIHSWSDDIQVPADLGAVVNKALSNDPERRYDSVFEFGRALLEFATPRWRPVYEKDFEDPPLERSAEPLGPDSSRIQSMRVPLPGSSRASNGTAAASLTRGPRGGAEPVPNRAAAFPTRPYSRGDEERLRAELLSRSSSPGAALLSSVAPVPAPRIEAPASEKSRPPRHGLRRSTVAAVGVATLLSAGAFIWKRATGPEIQPDLERVGVPALVQSDLKASRTGQSTPLEGAQSNSGRTAQGGAAAAAMESPKGAAVEDNVGVSGADLTRLQENSVERSTFPGEPLPEGGGVIPSLGKGKPRESLVPQFREAAKRPHVSGRRRTADGEEKKRTSPTERANRDTAREAPQGQRPRRVLETGRTSEGMVLP
jgi:serine/threonine protein kinase